MSIENGPSRRVIKRRELGNVAPEGVETTPEEIHPEILESKARTFGEIIGRPVTLTYDLIPGDIPVAVVKSDLKHHVGEKNLKEVAKLIPQIDGLVVRRRNPTE